MKPRRLTQAQVVIECNEAYQRYARMAADGPVTTAREADLHFAFELQGYMAWLMQDAHLTMVEAQSKVVRLMVLFEKANRET